jgi:hypothetical protein
MQMASTGQPEGSNNRSSILHGNDTTKGSEDPATTLITPQWIIVLTSVPCMVLFIAVLACYIKACRRRNSGNTHRQIVSESGDLYQNVDITTGPQTVDSLETVANPQLPLLPEMNRPPAGQPEIPEDVYLKPITKDRLWFSRREEIERLPPAPPVFPGGLASLPVDGENAYTIVISDDTAPLLTPGPTHELTHHQPLRENREDDSGYVVPSSLAENSVQQNVTETDLSPEPKEIRQNGNECQMGAMTARTSCGAAELCPDMSDGTSLADGASVSNDTWNGTERPRNTPRKRYRSECQVILSPLTQHRSIQVSTSTPTLI